MFGFTPADTALSALGLNCAQLLIDFVCVQTRISYVLFCGGFLYGIAQVVQHNNYRPLIIFFVLTLAVVLVLLPKRSEGAVESAVERYSSSAHNSQALKDQIINYHQIPIIFGFLCQAVDAFLVGSVHALDAFMAPWAKYLSAPFGIHADCLNIREALQIGITDIKLRKLLRKFLADQYLPAVSMFKHDSPSIDFNELWPGHGKIMPYYPAAARKEWGRLSGQLKVMMDGNSNFAAAVRGDLGNLTKTTPDIVQESLIKSIVTNELKEMERSQQLQLPFQISAWVIRIFPFIYGFFNLLLYVSFPFLVLAMAATLNIRLIKPYMKAFVWIKSWALAAALSFYASLLSVHLQGHALTDPSWAWERPYFCVAAALMLVCVPGMTFVCFMGRNNN